MTTTATYLWERGELRPLTTDPPGALRVADSWRQVDGRVRRLDLHHARFGRSVAAVTERVDGDVDVARFLDAARACVPEGEWFPRVRLVGDALLLDVRPGPERAPTAVVSVLPPGDPRSSPLVKGPDLALAGRLIAEARHVGADEVMVRDDDGVVLEAGYAAIVWWVAGDLCVPAGRLPVLPSVTRAVVQERARAHGIGIREIAARPADLDGSETWLLSAYQGVRLVTGWVGASITPGAGERFSSWRQEIDELG